MKPKGTAMAAKPHTETVTIQKRWTWLAALNIEVECDPATPPRVKLGLAVRAAYSRGAVLTGAVLTGADLTDAVLTGADLTDAVLTGAVLRGADLTGADLTDAVLTGADLTGADLTDAVLRGEKIERIFAIAGRLDGYTFYGVQLRTGGVKIAAGCRWFSLAEFREHVAREYPDTSKAAETLDIIEFIEKRSAGLVAPVLDAPTEAVA